MVNTQEWLDENYLKEEIIKLVDKLNQIKQHESYNELPWTSDRIFGVRFRGN